MKTENIEMEIGPVEEFVASNLEKLLQTAGSIRQDYRNKRYRKYTLKTVDQASLHLIKEKKIVVIYAYTFPEVLTHRLLEIYYCLNEYDALMQVLRNIDENDYEIVMVIDNHNIEEFPWKQDGKLLHRQEGWRKLMNQYSSQILGKLLTQAKRNKQIKAQRGVPGWVVRDSRKQKVNEKYMKTRSIKPRN